MRSLLLPLLFVAAVSASAQPITVTLQAPQAAGAFSGGTAGTFQSNVGFSHAIEGSAYRFNLRGDVTAQFTGTATDFSHQFWAFATLTTGAAPVLLSDIQVAFNGKEVPSGGSTASYVTRQFYRALVYVPRFGPDISFDTYLPDRTTQGVYIEDRTHDLPWTILAANTSYRLYMDVWPDVRINSYPPGSSMLGFAAEFGGSVSPGFKGLTLSFNAVAVPESGTWLLMGLGLAVLGRVRRPTTA